MEKVMIETSRSSKTDEAADYLAIKIVLAAFVMSRVNYHGRFGKPKRTVASLDWSGV